MEKCSYPSGMVIKPDGKNELDPCFYDDIATYKNVTVTISKCKRCGHVEISWKRQENTEEVE